jgi:hypothetical protein
VIVELISVGTELLIGQIDNTNATTPSTEIGRVFSFGGNDERLRAIATIAGLHMIRLAISD